MEEILDWVKITLEYVFKLPWTWVVLIVIWYFRKELRQLLSSFYTVFNRIEKIGSDGIILSRGLTSPSTNPQSSSIHFELINAYQSAFVTDEEKLIRKELEEVTTEQACEVLFKHLAYANFVMRLFRIDKIIYPEQIKILRHLNTIKSCSKEDLSKFYEEWLRGDGNSNYSFDSFLGFLFDEGLINEYRFMYSIADLGKEYLVFLVKKGGL